MNTIVAQCDDGAVDIAANYSNFITLENIVNEGAREIPINCATALLNALIQFNEGAFKSRTSEAMLNLANYLEYRHIDSLLSSIDLKKFDLSLVSDPKLIDKLIHSSSISIVNIVANNPLIFSTDEYRRFFRLCDKLKDIPSKLFCDDYSKICKTLITSVVLRFNDRDYIIKGVIENQSFIAERIGVLWHIDKSTGGIKQLMIVGQKRYSVEVADACFCVKLDSGLSEGFDRYGISIYSSSGTVIVRNGNIYSSENDWVRIIQISPRLLINRMNYKIKSIGKYHALTDDSIIKMADGHQRSNLRRPYNEIIYCPAYDIDLLIFRDGISTIIYTMKETLLFAQRSPKAVIHDTYIFWSEWNDYSCVHWPSGKAVFKNRSITHSVINRSFVYTAME